MGVRALWQTSATALVILIVLNLLYAGLNPLAWQVLGILSLLGMMVFCFFQGQRVGHGACGVSSTVDAARAAGEKVYGQLDRKYLSQAWSRTNGVKGVLAGALIPYAVGGVYIILSLLWRLHPGLETAATVARIPAWLLSLPYWPLIMRFHESFVQLTPDIAAMLLITPFILPLCVYFGYLRGPKLWARTEDAMRQGRRRAKARARVGKKLAPRTQKPEI